MKPETKKEDAVSPVVGVMLMLVVTIVIAAVVAAFAGGLAADTESTPNAIFEVTYSNVTTTGNWGGSLYETYFLQKGGDSIKIDELSIKIGRDDFSQLGSISPTTVSGSSSIHSGDMIQVNMDGKIASLYSGDVLEWQVIYKKTGNVIASGTFTV